MELLIFFLSLALGVSFLCSISEAVLLSTSVSFVQSKSAEGKRSGKILLKLKENIDRPLAAILSINTVAHTVGAAGVGAQAAKIFGEAYFGIISAILTLLILVLSEIIPKTIGATYWRELALPFGRIIQGMVYISYPLVLFSEIITKVFAKKGRKNISREEFAMMAYLGSKEGVFDEKENAIIQNLLRLKSIKARDVMTPRTVVSAASESLTLHEFFQSPEYLSHSRIPVYSGSNDNVTGYVLKYDVLENIAKGNKALELKDLLRKIIIFAEEAPLPQIFEELLRKKEHISLIVDEYGAMKGLVSMEDIFETMLGLEIIDERDKEIDMRELAKQKWKIRARKLKLHNLGDFKPPDKSD